MENKERVIVLDFGGQYNQLIARRVRECNVYCEILPYTVSLDKIKELIKEFKREKIGLVSVLNEVYLTDMEIY